MEERGRCDEGLLIFAVSANMEYSAWVKEAEGDWSARWGDGRGGGVPRCRW